MLEMREQYIFYYCIQVLCGCQKRGLSWGGSFTGKHHNKGATDDVPTSSHPYCNVPSDDGEPVTMWSKLPGEEYTS